MCSTGVILSHALPSIKLAIYDAVQHDFGRQFGAVLFELWKLERARVEGPDATAGHTQVEEILQSIISEAAFAASPRHFHALRAVVVAFVDVNRSSKAVSSMIETIIRPILWRSLNCANASVRSQAAVLLFDGFPFQNADWSAEECDQMMQRQFDAMTRLLKDSDHKVRAHAATGVSSVLVQYWQELPAATTRELLSHFIGKLACDSASADVRQAVISGLGRLLDEQPLAHGVLVTLLPHVGKSIHDQSEKVRLAVLSLLLKVFLLSQPELSHADLRCTHTGKTHAGHPLLRCRVGGCALSSAGGRPRSTSGVHCHRGAAAQLVLRHLGCRQRPGGSAVHWAGAGAAVSAFCSHAS